MSVVASTFPVIGSDWRSNIMITSANSNTYISQMVHLAIKKVDEFLIEENLSAVFTISI